MIPVDYTKLSWQQRKVIREQYIKEQNGLCFYCKKALSKEPIMNKKINLELFPPNFFKYKVHLQHNHKTNMTEGVVHNYCNAVMWQYHGK